MANSGCAAANSEPYPTRSVLMLKHEPWGGRHGEHLPGAPALDSALPPWRSNRPTSRLNPREVILVGALGGSSVGPARPGP